MIFKEHIIHITKDFQKSPSTFRRYIFCAFTYCKFITIMESFIKFEGQNEIEFLERFSDEKACFAYLAQHKWANGFACPNCESTQEDNCKIEFHKRCKKCLHMISPTSHTLFDKVKCGIFKGFLCSF